MRGAFCAARVSFARRLSIYGGDIAINLVQKGGREREWERDGESRKIFETKIFCLFFAIFGNVDRRSGMVKLVWARELVFVTSCNSCFV